MDEQDPTRLVRTTVVDAPVEQAFWAFVDRFDEVKPCEQNLLSSQLVETTFVPARDVDAWRPREGMVVQRR